MSQHRINIDLLSCTALRIEPRFGEEMLSTATGFTIRYDDRIFLITNWHVVTGRNADTDECLSSNAAIPDRLAISFHASTDLGHWVNIEVPLFDLDGQSLWIEHPLGKEIDVVALAIPELPSIVIYPLDLSLANVDMVLSPAMPVSIIGYPLGLTSGGNWPIWKTGHIASDPDVDYESNRPAFLIDATTRKGMSGSPVIVRINGGYTSRDGAYILSGGLRTKFAGIYAGRIHNESEVGRVWRPFVIDEIMKRKLLYSEETRRVVPRRNGDCECRSGEKYKDCCGRFT